MVKSSTIIAPRLQGKSSSNKNAVAGALVAQLLNNMQPEVSTQREASHHFLDVVEDFMELNKAGRELRQAYQETVAVCSGQVQVPAHQIVELVAAPAQSPVPAPKVPAQQTYYVMQPVQEQPKPAPVQKLYMVQPAQKPAAAAQEVVYTVQVAQKPAPAQKVVYMVQPQKPAQQVVYTLQAAQQPTNQVVYLQPAQQPAPIAAEQPVAPVAAPQQQPEAVKSVVPVAAQLVQLVQPAAQPTAQRLILQQPILVQAPVAEAKPAMRPAFVQAVSDNLSAVLQKNAHATYVAAPQTLLPGEAVVDVDRLGLTPQTNCQEALATIETELRKTQAKSLMLVGSMNTLRHLFEGTSNFLARSINEALTPEKQPKTGESHLQMLMRNLATDEFAASPEAKAWLQQAKTEALQQQTAQPQTLPAVDDGFDSMSDSSDFDVDSWNSSSDVSSESSSFF